MGRSSPSWLRPALAAAAVVLGVVAVVGAVSLLRTERTVTIGENTLVNAPGIVDAHNSPGVVRSPTDGDNFVIVHRVDRPPFSAQLHTSSDGGASWQLTELPLPAGLDRPFAPDASFAPDGTLYVSYVNLTGQGNVPDNLWLVSSDDGGRTLSDPVRVAGELAFQARLATGPDGTVHLTYLQATDVALLQLVGRAPVVAVRSEDGGQSFTEPVPVSDDDRLRVGAASPVIDADGNITVLYQDFKDNVRDFQNLEGPPWTEPSALVVTRSVDGGRSFSPGVELESGLIGTKRFLVFLPEFPSLAAGPQGELFVAWADGRNGAEDVYLRRSGDGGQTWTDALRVNDNPVDDGTAQYLPALAVARNGRVDVVFFDRRNDPANLRNDAYLATSEDGGGSFRNIRLSSESFDSRVGPSAGPLLPADLGTRLGLAATAQSSLAAWTDTRLGTIETERQDIMTSRVDHPDLSGLTWRWAVVIGSVLAALLALFAWRVKAAPVQRSREQS